MTGNEIPTLGELFRVRAVTDGELSAAVTSFFADPRPGPREIARGIRLDIAAAVAAHEWACRVVADEAIVATARRNAVRAAILRARPL
ncbi:conserved hypothetical protein [Methylobacterium sp. 4-46]|uniref:hypothetical protein n=1 Tax=unclassified Methylobacterium TaxID=2615210 RepID=UPI000165C6E4|nr:MULTISPECIES: hypothetical protein [Methylobacterium]ACA16502.1 conserved hypothetical protein [Methylobacterium sp. 4-46]WFT82211.1 hypothetical protein QA634_10330 [Methylobacterium nodulans]